VPDSLQPYFHRIEPVATASLRLLHPSGIEDAGEVRALLERARAENVVLRRGMNRRILPETARIERLDGDQILLRTDNFEHRGAQQIFLNFVLDDRPYFFASRLVGASNGRLRIEMPGVVHEAERRDRRRQRAGGAGERVEVGAAVAEVEDRSPGGLGLRLPWPSAPAVGADVQVQFLDGPRAGERVAANVRNRRAEDAAGWVRIGLDVLTARRGAAVQTLRSDEDRSQRGLLRARQRWQVLSAGARLASDRAWARIRAKRASPPPIEIVDYENAAGEKMRAIVDAWGPTRGAPAVVIPPAWGRTKETLMPLAACIVAAFRRAREPVVVVRYDGVRKRGESHRDPECRAPGKDHHRFTFTQGVRDIRATLDFLERSPRFRCERAILVSFSAAAIEARRATARDERIRGWVSVVGAPDLQSMMRVISGGVDYAVGLERGVRFGLQEILGVEVDMDHAGLDAFAHDLVYLDDARRDMAAIRVPITWIRGRHDAWMDADRVRDALSCGDTANRCFIEVPTGHMLKSSREALETFQLIVREISRMLLGRAIRPALPVLSQMEARQRAERARLPRETGDIRAFWRDYLVGRDAVLGIELMTSITPYEDLMTAQVRTLKLAPGDRVADLGSGTGALPLHLLRGSGAPPGLRIVEVDYVREGLDRARYRLAERGGAGDLGVRFLEADLGGAGIPLASASVDAALGALLLSYVDDPERLLREMFRILKPGGRIAVSSLRPDADMSKLYREGIEELRAGRARERFGPGSEDLIETAARGYLNQASRLLDLEERGVFRFRDGAELARMVRRAGFRAVAVERSLGQPPQAVLVSGERR
jgi:ubiquinone/menaquinone biosynthesis C-methylase UbiE/dienelactone hydrolase